MHVCSICPVHFTSFEYQGCLCKCWEVHVCSGDVTFKSDWDLQYCSSGINQKNKKAQWIICICVCSPWCLCEHTPPRFGCKGRHWLLLTVHDHCQLTDCNVQQDRTAGFIGCSWSVGTSELELHNWHLTRKRAGLWSFSLEWNHHNKHNN